MPSNVWRRAAEAAIGAIVFVIATVLSEELARIVRDVDQATQSEKGS